jgi:hypothetical protein
MTRATRHRWWLTNRVVNPILRPLLRGPRPAIVGRRLAVLRYRGRRSQQTHELLVQYAQDANTIWIVPGHSKSKQWWRNFRAPADVDIWLHGQHHRGHAVVVNGERDPDQAAVGVSTYLSTLPRAGRAVSAASPQGLILVRVDLVD